MPHIYSQLGSTLHLQSTSCDLAIIGGFRCGDYDFFTRTLIPIYFEFGDLIPGRRWVNFGGGLHITRPDYDRDLLVELIRGFRARWNHIPVYLEPGEAVELGTGVLVASVMDVLHNGMDLAILDTSATAHMPDVLEMPYRPVIIDAGEPGAKAHTYRLGGLTCLAGNDAGNSTLRASHMSQ